LLTPTCSLIHGFSTNGTVVNGAEKLVHQVSFKSFQD